MEIKRLNHASFVIKGKKTIYIDPFELQDEEKADIILITHPHFDHCSPEDINRLSKKGTLIIAPTKRLCPGIESDIMALSPWESIIIDGTEITGIPSYNLKKHYHPRQSGWLGYVIDTDGTRIYHAGDTDLIPEMKLVKNIDYALLPVSGQYTMTAEEAAQAAAIIKPKVAIPMHYGNIIGSIGDAENFRSLCHCNVQIH